MRYLQIFKTLFAAALLFCMSTSLKSEVKTLKIIPYPQKVTLKADSFEIQKKTVIVSHVSNSQEQNVIQAFKDRLKKVTGYNLKIQNSIPENYKGNVIEFVNSLNLPAEGYEISIDSHKTTIKSSTANGCFYALQTIYQMLPPDIYGKSEIENVKWVLPGVEIQDQPRFSYRGMHLDVSRHFFSVEFIKKYIDELAMHKMNTFHWHLTDDQGWRIEIKKYPELTKTGSKRKETLVGHYFQYNPQHFDGKEYKGYYTQEEAREIVKYAADRFITVIPEIEMPGHATAAIAAYPFLSSTQEKIDVATKWGVFDDVFCPRDTTFKFLENVLDEIMAIFPSKYIHIGGDECPKTSWKNSDECQEIIKKNGLKDEHELQSYFIQRIEKYLNSKGREIIGWDEILEGGLAPNATVMSWRGFDGGVAAAQSKHKVIMTPGEFCYFDHYQGEPDTEPLSIGGYTSVAKVYQFDPVPATLKADERQYVLGAQGNVWTEYMPDNKQVEYMVFPRIDALSEVLWTNAENKDYVRFCSILPEQFKRYDVQKINASKAFFGITSSVRVEGGKLVVKLHTDAPNQQIYYTTDGSDPVTTSNVYPDSLVLSQTTTIRAQCYAGNVKMGNELKKDFPVSKITGFALYSSVPSLKNMKVDGVLTDGKYASVNTTDDWLVLGGIGNREVVYDLKTPQTIHSVKMGFEFKPTVRALYPKTVKIMTSLDGEHFQEATFVQMSNPADDYTKLFRPELKFSATDARFVKVIFENAGKYNDVDGVSASSILILDEIEIN